VFGGAGWFCATRIQYLSAQAVKFHPATLLAMDQYSIMAKIDKIDVPFQVGNAQVRHRCFTVFIFYCFPPILIKQVN
jgi:hypothetical protein